MHGALWTWLAYRGFDIAMCRSIKKSDRLKRRRSMDPEIAPLLPAAMADPEKAFRSLLYNDDTYLFRVAIVCKTLWRAATRKLTEECEQPRYRKDLIPAMPQLPVELRNRIMKLLDLRDLCRLSTASRFFHAECSHYINSYMESKFLAVGLSWTSFRYMLTQTGAVVAGFYLYHLLYFDNAFDAAVDAVDVYVRDGRDRTLLDRYLSVATEYTKVRTVCNPSLWIVETAYYNRPGQRIELVVHRCWQEPRETVLREPLTCVYSWMCGKGVFVAYPDLTFNQGSMVSHSDLPLRNAEYDLTAALGIRDLAHKHGVSIHRYHSDEAKYLDLERRTRCALSSSCPSNHRNTFDTVSFQMLFNDTGWHRGNARQDIEVDVYWVLGAMDCVLENRGVCRSVRSERHFDRPYANEDRSIEQGGAIVDHPRFVAMTERVGKQERAKCITRQGFTGVKHPYVSYGSSDYLDDRQLFKIAIAKPNLWKAAASMYTRECSKPIFRSNKFKFGVEPSAIPLRRLPPEIQLLLPSGLDLRGLCSLGATCTFFRKECMLVFNARMERAFDSLDLDWKAIRFMLAQCNAVVSGWFLYHLVRMDFSKLSRVTTLDVYVRKGEDTELVDRFLRVATTYRTRIVQNYNFNADRGIYDTVYYDHPSKPFTIAVHYCWDAPKLAILRGPLTCLHSWMCGNGLCITNAEFTFEAQTIIAWQCTRLTPGVFEGHIRFLRSTAASHGVATTSFHEDCGHSPPPYDCSTSRTCPTQPRSSFDALSFQTMFTHSSWQRRGDGHSHLTDIYWVLDASDCCVERSNIKFSAVEVDQERRKRASGGLTMSMLGQRVFWY
ncbi:hypothetical protein B0H12DRAFT_1073026 [Mycena haematopus]|nr:hypothetical protein B0H12DRAFT_1073026 [Mycena haematopus]